MPSTHVTLRHVIAAARWRTNILRYDTTPVTHAATPFVRATFSRADAPPPSLLAVVRALPRARRSALLKRRASAAAMPMRARQRASVALRAREPAAARYALSAAAAVAVVFTSCRRRQYATW